MKTKKLLQFNFLLLGCFFYAQVGIGTKLPEATLDIRSKNHVDGGNPGANISKDGILIPRVSSIATNGQAEGQLLYLTVNEGINSKGFYSWDATNNSWVPLGKQSGSTVGRKYENVSFAATPSTYVIKDTDAYIVFTGDGTSATQTLNLPDATLPINKNRVLCFKNSTGISGTSFLIGYNPSPKGIAGTTSSSGITHQCVVSDGTEWYALEGK